VNRKKGFNLLPSGPIAIAVAFSESVIQRRLHARWHWLTPISTPCPLLAKQVRGSKPDVFALQTAEFLGKHPGIEEIRAAMRRLNRVCPGTAAVLVNPYFEFSGLVIDGGPGDEHFEPGPLLEFLEAADGDRLFEIVIARGFIIVDDRKVEPAPIDGPP
jgi:hypothetical protein